VSDAGADAGGHPEGGPGAGGTQVRLADGTAAGGHALLWVAFNDGDGPWQAVPGIGPVYTVEVRSGRYGLAFVCESDLGAPSGEVIHASVDELPAVTVFCGEAPPSTYRKLAGKISGLPPDASVLLQVRGGFAALDAPVTGYSMTAPVGTFDLGVFASVKGRATQALVRRDVVISADTTLDLDFATQGVALVRQPLRVSGAPAGTVEWKGSTALVTASDSLLWGDDDVSHSPADYAALPASALRPGESQKFELGVNGPLPAAQDFVGVIRTFREPAALDVALPAPFASPQVSRAAGAGARPRVTFQPYPGALFYQLVCSQQVGRAEVSWLSIFTPAWLGGATSYELPDWSTVPGFHYGFSPGGLVGETDAVLSNRNLPRTLHDDPATRDGAELKYARRSFVLQP
jgi:hypothetical protein